jgi:hypothetical protein
LKTPLHEAHCWFDGGDNIVNITNTIIADASNVIIFYPHQDRGLPSLISPAVNIMPNFSYDAKKQAFLINFCDCNQVKTKCRKYLKHLVDLPINQESQSTFFLHKFLLKDIQASCYKLVGKVGGVASSAFIPMPSTKARLIEQFLCLIYDHKTMMIDMDTVSYWLASTTIYSHSEYIVDL